MQEILTLITIFAAVILLVYKTTHSLKSFKKEDSCGGCGGSCGGCPVAQANRKTANR